MILLSLILLQEALDLTDPDVGMHNFFVQLYRCWIKLCSGDRREGKGLWSHYSLNWPFSLPSYGQHISYWPLLVAETLYLAFVTTGWCDGYRVPYRGTSQIRLWASWLSCHVDVTVARVCNYEVLFLFNVIDYSRFSKSSVFPFDFLPLHPYYLSCNPLSPLRKEPAL